MLLKTLLKTIAVMQLITVASLMLATHLATCPEQKARREAQTKADGTDAENHAEHM